MNRTKSLYKLKELLDDPKTTAKDVADLISMDPDFTEFLTDLLKSIGFSPVDCRLELAVNYFGFDVLKNMVDEQPGFVNTLDRLPQHTAFCI
jgi:hypothetical protein